MRRKKQTKYQSPCFQLTYLELEDLICGSTPLSVTVDELHNENINSSEPYLGETEDDIIVF